MKKRKLLEEKNGSDIEFKVFEDKKTVVCRIWNCHMTAKNRIHKYTHDVTVYGTEDIPDVFVGIARCAPEDEFDVEFGKKLALTRAKEKRGKAINEAIYSYIDDIQRGLRDLEKYGIHNVPNPRKLYEEV